MHSKLAGRLSLQDTIEQTLQSARSKLAAAEEKKDEKKPNPFAAKKDEKKKEDEAKEKKSSAIDFSDPEEVTKLAAALDEVGEDLLKVADSIENGGESRQGGEQLPTQSPTGGRQVYTGAKATSRHQVPNSTGTQSTKDNPGPSTAVSTDDGRAPGGNGARYPANGPLRKTGAAALQAVVEKVAFSISNEGHKLDARTYAAQARAAHEKGKAHEEYVENGGSGKAGLATAADLLVGGGVGGKASYLNRLGNFLQERHLDYAAKKHEEGHNAYNPFGGLLTKSRFEKKSAAVDYILDKISEVHGGGETLDDKGAPVPANPGRQLIANNSAPVSATKREAKAPVKKPLSEVLTEPAMTSRTDNTVQQNLRNAAKGGVKIAAVKKAAVLEYLKKVAEAGCVCGSKGECDYCRMKDQVEKKRADRKVKQSLGMGAPMGAPTGSSPAPVPPAMA